MGSSAIGKIFFSGKDLQIEPCGKVDASVFLRTTKTAGMEVGEMGILTSDPLP